MVQGRRQVNAGFGPIPGGVHGGLHPSLIQETQYAAGLNVSTRGGFVSTRPGFKKLLSLGTGVFQGAGRYRLNEGDRIIFVQSGKVKQIKLFEDSLSVSEYVVQPITFNKRNGEDEAGGYPFVAVTQSISPNFGKTDSGSWSDRVNMAKAERFFIVQDGYHQPVIIGEFEDPDFARVSYQSPYAYPGTVTGFFSYDFHYSEVPVGLSMAYASRRLCVSPRYEWEDLTGIYPDQPRSGRMTFVASDIDSNVGDCLRFIENNFASGGGSISLPLESGFINGMSPFRNSEAVDGNGALVVFGQDGVSAFTMAFERSAWLDDKQAISQMLFQGVGTYSPRSVLPINDDLWFRRPDGIASVRYTGSQMAGNAGSLSVTPQSFEVSHRLERDSFDDLPFVSLDFVDNRMFVTSGGRDPFTSGFRSLLILDSASMYSMSSGAAPIYDDMWTGVNFMQLVSGRYKKKATQFFFGICNNSNELGFYMIDPEAKDDDGVPILSRFYTRQYSFESADFKRFSKCELWIRDLVGDATVTLYWRPDGYYLWKQCNSVKLRSSVNGLPQSRYRITFSPVEENPCDEATGRPLRAGTAFQFCLEWRGSLRLEKGIFFADVETAQEPVVSCQDEELTALVESDESGVVLNDYEYSLCGG